MGLQVIFITLRVLVQDIPHFIHIFWSQTIVLKPFEAFHRSFSGYSYSKSISDVRCASHGTDQACRPWCSDYRTPENRTSGHSCPLKRNSYLLCRPYNFTPYARLSTLLSPDAPSQLLHHTWSSTFRYSLCLLAHPQRT